MKKPFTSTTNVCLYIVCTNTMWQRYCTIEQVKCFLEKVGGTIYTLRQAICFCFFCLFVMLRSPKPCVTRSHAWYGQKVVSWGFNLQQERYGFLSYFWILKIKKLLELWFCLWHGRRYTSSFKNNFFKEKL